MIPCKHDTCTVFHQYVSSCDSDTLSCQRIMSNIHNTWTDSLKGGSSCVPGRLKCIRMFDCTRYTCVSFQKWESSHIHVHEYIFVCNPETSHRHLPCVAAKRSQWTSHHSWYRTTYWRSASVFLKIGQKKKRIFITVMQNTQHMRMHFKEQWISKTYTSWRLHLEANQCTFQWGI